mgnify:CR=1 FL=1
MSTYKPRRQGKRDAKEGKSPYRHASAWNQREYDFGYAQGLAESQREAQLAARSTPSLEERVAALEEILS